jgi:DNA-binding GntR family transcriptional regulator
MIEAREALEVKLAALAAERRTDADVEDGGRTAVGPGLGARIALSDDSGGLLRRHDQRFGAFPAYLGRKCAEPAIISRWRAVPGPQHRRRRHQPGFARVVTPVRDYLARVDSDRVGITAESRG